MTGPVRVEPVTVSDWPAVRLATSELEVTVVPGKGADVTSVRELGAGTELLWRPRWGLRPPTAAGQPGSDEALALDRSGGGWNTLFPNGGRPSQEYGVTWGFHGEAWVAPYEWRPTPSGIRAHTMLTRSPFAVVKEIALDSSSVRVTETVTNVGAGPIDVLWCQHPTFAAPLVSAATTVEVTACRVHPDIDDEDPVPGQASVWPQHHEGGRSLDLSRLGPARQGESRRAFLGAFADEQVHARVTNPELGLGVELSWLASDFPYAWYWFEAGGHTQYPWFGAEYALAIEPATGYPSGVARARALTGTHLSIGAGQTLTKSVTLTAFRG